MTSASVQRQEGSTPAHPSRYVTLDGLRGLAALCVATYHYAMDLMPGGYLAVDFFFALSGFVLFKTYAARLAAGSSVASFAKARVIRLMPLHVLGVALGAVFVVQGILRNSDFHLDPMVFALSLPLNLVMVPSPFDKNLFPLNVPAWSLFFEVAVNVLMAAVLLRLGRAGWWTLCLVCAVLLLVLNLGWVDGAAIGLAAEGMNGGSSWSTAHTGLLRTLLAFTAGMLIADAHDVVVRRSSLQALVLGLVLVALLALRVADQARAIYDLAVVVLATPILLILGSRIEPPQWLRGGAGFIGEVSFALYAIHGPIAAGTNFFARKLGLSQLTMLPVFLGAALVLAWLAVRYFDTPARAILRRRFAAKPAAALA